MVNAWSLLYDVLNGTLDKEYPIVNKKEIDETNFDLDKIERMGGFEWTPGSPWPPRDPDDDGLDYEIDTMSDIDDMYSHHFLSEESMKTNYNFKYHEDEILKDIQEYVSRTYQGHYTGTKHEFRKVQTIDLMAARDIAPQFCQANILKYGSRYGSKDGKNKTDLLKVIHYAMLLLHFNEHYNKPPMTTGNIDINMP